MKRLMNFLPGWLFLLVFSFLFMGKVNSTHIIGGEVIYQCLGGNVYEIKIKVYRDCSPGTAAYDNPLYFSVWDGEVSSNFLDSAVIPFPGAIELQMVSSDTCLTLPSGVCVEEAIYMNTIILPPSASGYYFVYQRCCLTNILVNIPSPGSAGVTYFGTVTNSSYCNSSPVFNNPPPLEICVDHPFVYDHSATDPDGDSLVYYICEGYNGADVGPSQPEITSPPPYTPYTYTSPYSGTYPVSSSPALAINSQTGELTGTPNLIGACTVGICCDEYRSGVLIGTHRRDFRFSVVNCIQNPNCGLGMLSSDNPTLMVYPNPAVDILRFNSDQAITLTIYDLTGKVVFISSFSGESDIISIANWSAGVYTYQARSKSGVAFGKFIKM